MKIDELLQEELELEIDELSKIEVGTDTYRTAVDGVTKLADRVIKIKELEAETEIKQKELDEEKKDRKIKNILTGLGIAVPTGVTIWGTLKSLKFEETGTVTTSVGRQFINKLFKK